MIACRTQLPTRSPWAVHQFGDLVTADPGFAGVLERARRVAPTAASVLVLGETGTGKELLARAVHDASERRGRFVAVNCAAIPEGLAAAELFGCVQGAYTGADRRREGLFQSADGGTLLLDEVGDLSPALQTSLLRVLEEGRVRPLGGAAEATVDVRILAATSRDVDQAVADGRFRADLLYRLDVVRCVLPPLRLRPADIPLLFERFLREAAEHHCVAPPQPQDCLIDRLLEHPWPGNARQLRNAAERAVLLRAGRPLGPQHLGYSLWAAAPGDDPREAPGVDPVRGGPAQSLESFLKDAERRYLERVLEHTGGHVQRTAHIAGVSRRTIARKLREHSLARETFASS